MTFRDSLPRSQLIMVKTRVLLKFFILSLADRMALTRRCLQGVVVLQVIRRLALLVTMPSSAVFLSVLLEPFDRSLIHLR